MACTKHDLSDNIQDGLDIEKCINCKGVGFTSSTHPNYWNDGIEVVLQKRDRYSNYNKMSKEERASRRRGYGRMHLKHRNLEHVFADENAIGYVRFCEPCKGSGFGEKVKKVWYEDCHKCEGKGWVAWGSEDKVCWSCGGAKKRAFKTSPETRAKRRATAQIKRNEKEALRIENELARQRTIYGGLTFAEKEAQIKAQWAEEKAKAQDVPTGTVRIWGEVLKVDLKETRFGEVLKMTVKDHRNGFVVWGSVPSIYDDEGVAVFVGKGDHISFTATVTPSDKDAKFGFFKRPRKAVISKVSN
jgi:hypothetical protein